MHQFLDILTHLDTQLAKMIQEYGPQIYWIMAFTLFIETGLVILPFLPGDTLLFTAGLFSRPDAMEGHLNIWVLLTALPFASILGDMVNFNLGRWFGGRLFTETSKGIFHKNNLQKTRDFFARYGGKSIIIGRFVPVIRALAPFVAGMEGMEFRKFVPLSTIANFVWVWVCAGAGHLFGGIPFVQENFELILLGLAVVMFVSIVLEIRRDAKHRAKLAGKDLAADTHKST